MIGNRRLKLIKSMRVGRTGHEARVGAKINVYRALVVRSEVTKLFPVPKTVDSIILKL
jgi:hypothetical protein